MSRVLSDVPYIRWAKEHAFDGEFNLTMSAVPAVDWDDLELDPRSLALSEFSAYGDEEVRAGVGGEWGWGPERVFLGASASHTHFCFAATAVEPGERVLYERPGYLPLLNALSLLGVEAVPVERSFSGGFSLPQEDLLKEASDPRSRLLLLTDLHNPSGVALSAKDRNFLPQLCEQTGIEVIVDEMYRPFLDPDPGPLARLHPKIVTVGGLNKVHGLSQIRLGWGLATSESVSLAQRILDATTIHNSCLTDQVARFAWPLRKKLVERAREIATQGWEIVGPWLNRSPLKVVDPGGGLVCFPRIPESHFKDGDEFQRIALAAGVNVTPGRFFEAPQHVRIGWALPPEDLRKACSLLDQLF